MIKIIVLCSFTVFKVEIKDCRSDLGVNSDSIICAGGAGVGVCRVNFSLSSISKKLLIQGDSGGPLTTMKKNGEDRVHTLVGVVSFGIGSCDQVTPSHLFDLFCAPDSLFCSVH